MTPILDASAWQDFFASFPGLWPAVAAAAGAVLASFFGVLVDRLPLAEGLRTGVPDMSVNLWTPSRCPHCGTRISALALVPVLGWLIHRGRCFRCGAKVPWAYPAMEAFSAAASAAVACRFGPCGPGLAALSLLWGCIAISWMDWREHWIPDGFAVPLLLAGLVASPFEATPLMRSEALALCAGLVWILSAAVGARRRIDAVSGGDIMLAGLAGAWLGVALAAPFLLITAAAYVAYAVPLHLAFSRVGSAGAPREDMEDVAYSGPMGPALCASLMVCVWFGPALALPVPAWLGP